MRKIFHLDRPADRAKMQPTGLPSHGPAQALVQKSCPRVGHKFLSVSKEREKT